jgi:ketosteroid isomerase-like protein
VADDVRRPSVYKAIVKARVQRLWQRINQGDYEAAVKMAAPDLRFRFLAPDTPLDADVTGSQAFRTWFTRLFDLFPGITFEVRDIAVAGWPWNTTLTVRLGVGARLADGTRYENEARQAIRLRWGRMIEDFVQEDPVRLRAALDRQARAREERRR